LAGIDGGAGDALTAEPVNLLARLYWLRVEPKQASDYTGQRHMRGPGNPIESAAESGALAFAYGAHGHYREAIEAGEIGVAQAKGAKHQPTLAACYMYRAVVYGWFCRLQRSVTDFEQSLAIAERAGDLFRRYLIHGWRGEAYLLCDHDAAAEQELRQSVTLGEQIGTSFHRGAFQAFLARVLLRAGGVDQAQRESEEAVRVADQSRQPWSRSIALRVHAEALLAASPRRVEGAGGAEEAVRMAIGIQEQLDCRCDRAWSQLVLGRVLHAKGDREGAAVEYLSANRAFADMDIAHGIEKASAALATLRESHSRRAAKADSKRMSS